MALIMGHMKSLNGQICDLLKGAKIPLKVQNVPLKGHMTYLKGHFM